MELYLDAMELEGGDLVLTQPSSVVALEDPEEGDDDRALHLVSWEASCHRCRGDDDGDDHDRCFHGDGGGSDGTLVSVGG